MKFPGRKFSGGQFLGRNLLHWQFQGGPSSGQFPGWPGHGEPQQSQQQITQFPHLEQPFLGGPGHGAQQQMTQFLGGLPFYSELQQPSSSSSDNEGRPDDTSEQPIPGVVPPPGAGNQPPLPPPEAGHQPLLSPEAGHQPPLP